MRFIGVVILMAIWFGIGYEAGRNIEHNATQTVEGLVCEELPNGNYQITGKPK